jgi:hypothetical protein
MAKPKVIYINGRRHKTDRDFIDFSFIAGYAGFSFDQDVEVIWEKKTEAGSKIEGKLKPDSAMILEAGMVFRVKERK